MGKMQNRHNCPQDRKPLLRDRSILGKVGSRGGLLLADGRQGRRVLFAVATALAGGLLEELVSGQHRVWLCKEHWFAAPAVSSGHMW
jgi:hypothetical protein